ncbi:cAMP-responsive element modulator-like [Genypterus blacodes]|uniref:cAMP-responsive element modulator-like n=1 Tax=Genypterus blacodes TaxID=154954 RepID=UPI003F768826
MKGPFLLEELAVNMAVTGDETETGPAGTGGCSGYQPHKLPSSSLAQGGAMANIQRSQHLGEDASKRKELRLMKNREAARQCRRKKKEYVKCLENRVAVLENQNRTLIEELKALKDIYQHKVD